MNKKEREAFVLGMVIGLSLGIVFWAFVGLYLLAIGVIEL